jgi:amino acid adenylation domain-containing protein
MIDQPKTSALSNKKLELLASLLAEEGLEETSRAISWRKNRREFPLSSGQQRLWFLDRLESGIHYNDHFNLRLSGPLSAEILVRSIEEILRRHEAMRSVFTEVDGSPHQALAPPGPLSFRQLDLSTLPEPGRTAEATRVAVEEARTPFDLSKGALWRFTLILFAPDDHILLITAHHIAIDGWSRGVFLRELSVIYSALEMGAALPLKDPAIQYADYAAWQAEWLGSQDAARQLNYWKHKISGAPPLLELPTNCPRPQIQTFRGARHWLKIPPKTTEELKDLCRNERVTLFMALLAVLQILLNRYTGQDDILVGTPVAGRNRKELEGLIGYFLNTLVLRTQIYGDPTFRDVLQVARSTTLEALAHQDLPLEKIIDALEPERNQSYTPLFQVLLVLQNTPMPDLRVGDLRVRGWEIDNGTSKFDLTISLSETPDGLSGWIEYARDLFDSDRITRLDGHFQRLIEQIVANPNVLLSQLSLLTRSECSQLEQWNRTEADYPVDRCIHELFEEQVSRTPERIAIECRGEQWTYRQLNMRSDKVAANLQSLGVTRDTLVAICMERSLQMVAAVLGVLKAGGAYLPLDPAHPQERRAFILEEAQPKAVLTFENVEKWIAEDTAREQPFSGSSGEDSSKEAHQSALAYVIYTSGSTGKPKGVQIEHRAVVNFLNSMRREPGLTSDDVLLAVTTLSFDIAGLELHLPLTTGARVVIAPWEVAADGEALLREIDAHGITMLQATPATWRLMLAAGWKGTPRLKALCGGEAMPADLASELIPRCAELWNMYGPTETTIWSTLCRITDAENIHIGRPIDNTEIYILDASKQPMPVGLPGELLIGGEGLARGYLYRPDLTAERFVAHPFKPGARLYRTGDLARYRADCNIDCLGRLDFQVKIRGFRIELGEIEAQLATHPDVQQNVVVAREDTPGEKRLVAYVVPSPAARPGIASLRGHLQGMLPDYMVPAAFVLLESLPLTPNGKIDRKLLPAPEFDETEGKAGYVAPRTNAEERLTNIWEKVLKYSPIGVHDNFFDLGGHSLLAVTLFAKVEREFGHRLPLASLFQNATIAQLARLVEVDRKQADHWESLVCIREGSGGPGVFFVHGAGGNILIYLNLARLIHKEIPVYGLQSLGLDRQKRPLHTIEEMAVSYVDEMTRHQPVGPYVLAGYCMGGKVALEMARVLRKRGQSVAMVGMLDSFNINVTNAGGFKTGKLSFWGQSVTFHASNLFAYGWREAGLYLREKTRQAREAASGWSSSMIKNIHPVRRNGAIGGKVPVEEFIQSVNDRAGFAYVPRSYSGPVTLFKPKRNYSRFNDPKMGWSEVLKGPLEIVELDMNPHAMLIQPFVQKLAAEINIRLCDLFKLPPSHDGNR